MKKHNLRKAFALCALMAFVITGSAYAANVDVIEGEIKKDDPAAIEVIGEEHFKNAGTVNATESITVNGGYFNNTGTINTGILDIYGNANDNNNSPASEIKGEIFADKIIYRGIAGNLLDRKISAKLDTDELQIIGTTNLTGLRILNNDVLTNVDKIIVDSHGVRTALVINANTDIEYNKGSIILKNDGKGNEARIQVEEGANFTADNIIADTGKTMLQLDNTSSAVVNNIEVEDNAIFNLQTWANKADQTATFALNEITVGEGAVLRTAMYGSNSAAHITGNDVIST